MSPPPSPAVVRSPTDVLSALPYLFGVTPTESVVCVAAESQDDDLVLGPIARCDIDVVADHPLNAHADGECLNAPPLPPPALEDALETFDRVGCQVLLIAIYTDNPRKAHRAGLHVKAMLTWHGHAPMGVWAVSSRGIEDVIGNIESLPPEVLTSTEIAASFVASGYAPLRDEHEFEITRDPISEWVDLGHEGPHPSLTDVLRAADDLKSWRSIPPIYWPPEPVRTVMSGLLLPVARDALIAGMIGATIESLLSSHLQIDLTLDADHRQARTDLIRAIARHGPHPVAVEAIGAVAAASWHQGKGWQARILTAQALRLDPTHRLAQLVDELLTRGVSPPWVARDGPTGLIL